MGSAASSAVAPGGLFDSQLQAALFSQRAQQVLLFPISAHYFFAHAAPLFGIVSRQNIKEGTSWRYFGTELVLFACMSVAAPMAFLDTWLGRAVLAVHLPLHVGLTVGDFVNHAAVVRKGSFERHENPLGWLSSKLGLLADTSSHAAAIYLLGSSIADWAPWWLCLVLAPLGVAYYLATNRRFLPGRGLEAAASAMPVVVQCEARDPSAV